MRASNLFLCADGTLLTYDEWACEWTDRPGTQSGVYYSARGYDGWPIEANGEGVEGRWFAAQDEPAAEPEGEK